VRLIACTGMRWEEFSALPVHLVDWDDRSLLVEWTATYSGGRRHLVRQTKSKAGRRRIPIINQVTEPLERLIAFGDQRRAANPGFGDEVLVVTGADGAALNYSLWRTAISDARTASGVDLTAHELRHVAASMFITGELRAEEIAEIMGHASADYTRRVYGHLFPRDGRPLAKRLSDAYAAPGS
jgi:integrase